MEPAKPAPSQPTQVQGTKQDIRQEQKKALIKLGKDLDKTIPEYPLRKEFRQANSSVLTNHFTIKIDPKTQLHEYSIVISPAKMNKVLNNRITKKFVEEEAILKDNQAFFATDSTSRIVAWKKLPLPIVHDNTIPSTEPIDISVGKDTFSVKLQYLRPVKVGVLQEYAKAVFSENTDLVDTIGPTVNALNILVSKAISNQAIELKANKFFIKTAHSNLGRDGSLCAIRGYFYTVKPGMGQLLLNVNTCTSAFFRPKLVSEALDDESTFFALDKREDALKGLRVYITYERKSKGSTDLNAMEFRTGIIRGFGKPLNKQTFELQSDDGTREKITVKEYIEKTYNVKIEKPWSKAVNLGSKEKPSWFAPEHLRILPYQMLSRLVPEHLTKDMLAVACQPPAPTRARIELEGLSNMGISMGQGFVSFVSTTSVCSAEEI